MIHQTDASQTDTSMRMKTMKINLRKTAKLRKTGWNCTLFSILSLLASLLVIQSAQAQKLADSFAGFSQKSNEPISIEADSLEVLDDKKFAIFKGNVKATQGKFQLVAKKLKVTYTGGVGSKKDGKKNAQGIERIDATGKVAIATPDNQSATSDWAKFDVLNKIVTIGGNVVLSQGGNVMRGSKLVIDLNTGRSKFHSTSKATNGKRPRITGVFMPGKSKGMKNFGKKKSPPKPPAPKPAPESSGPPLPWTKPPQ